MAPEKKKHTGGRPLGSKNKIRFKDHLSLREIARLVELAKKRAETDSSILKFLLEQIFGRAVQPLGNDSNEVFKLQILRADDGDKNDKAPHISR